MPSSESEDFESADEGHSNVEKKDRKHRKSSSNYSDSTLGSGSDVKKTPQKSSPAVISIDKPKVDETDGWDDFDIDASEPVETKSIENKILPSSKSAVSETGPSSSDKAAKSSRKSQDTGWDDFDDWGVETSVKQKELSPKSTAPDAGIIEVTDRLAAASTTTSSSGWGWGWGMDSLLSSATAGITTLTNQVSQGISTVLETGIGAPDPEELARKSAKDVETKETKPEKLEDIKPDSTTESVETEDASSAGDGAFPFGSILKFVGSTGTKVITGGLDTLETIGRKTMEVLQDGDPGLAKKRAMLGLDPDKPVLSQVLKEAKAKAEEEDRIKEEKREAKEVHYENLFDDFEGLVHLEALEMLSRQVSMRIEERLRSLGSEEKMEMKETLQQVAELCEMPDEDDEADEDTLTNMPKDEAFLERLQKATEDLGVKLQFQPLVKQYTDILSWLENSESDFSDKAVYKRAISGLAQATALSVELYHKAAEMLLVKQRRLTADEADALTQMTTVLKKHTSEMATLFTGKMDSNATYENATEVNNYITNIFLEAHNSSKYIQNAFDLALPIIQIGAV